MHTTKLSNDDARHAGFAALQLMEGYQVNTLQLNPSAEDCGYGLKPAQPQGDPFFHPLDCEPTLQIGYAPISASHWKLTFDAFKSLWNLIKSIQWTADTSLIQYQLSQQARVWIITCRDGYHAKRADITFTSYGMAFDP